MVGHFVDKVLAKPVLDLGAGDQLPRGDAPLLVSVGLVLLVQDVELPADRKQLGPGGGQQALLGVVFGLPLLACNVELSNPTCGVILVILLIFFLWHILYRHKWDWFFKPYVSSRPNASVYPPTHRTIFWLLGLMAHPMSATPPRDL